MHKRISNCSNVPSSSSFVLNLHLGLWMAILVVQWSCRWRILDAAAAECLRDFASRRRGAYTKGVFLLLPITGVFVVQPNNYPQTDGNVQWMRLRNYKKSNSFDRVLCWICSCTPSTRRRNIKEQSRAVNILIIMFILLPFRNQFLLGLLFQ